MIDETSRPQNDGELETKPNLRLRARTSASGGGRYEEGTSPRSIERVAADPFDDRSANEAEVDLVCRRVESGSGVLELAVVVPVFNEAANVAPMVAALDQALIGLRWEVIFVDDDSPDGTADVARSIGIGDARVRVLQRIGRRGLASACIEGMCATAAPVVAVIDGDMQHDETLLPLMLETLEARSELDLVIGSRFAAGGGLGDWDEERAAQSAFATRLSRRILKADVSDPMSGFFAIRTARVRALAPHVSGIGFKILLDLMTASAHPLVFAELPYVFRSRERGESKLDHVVALEYLIALYDRMFGRFVPVRFALFAAIGLLGAGVHLSLLAVLFRAFAFDFLYATIGAITSSMTFNFLLNNALTYRDRRLRGVPALLRGWLSFCLLCSVGALANVGVAQFLFGYYSRSGGAWLLPALAGIAVAAVWNFALSSRFTWGRY